MNEWFEREWEKLEWFDRTYNTAIENDDEYALYLLDEWYEREVKKND